MVNFYYIAFGLVALPHCLFFNVLHHFFGHHLWYKWIKLYRWMQFLLMLGRKSFFAIALNGSKADLSKEWYRSVFHGGIKRTLLLILLHFQLNMICICQESNEAHHHQLNILLDEKDILKISYR